jgi:transposase-like protein
MNIADVYKRFPDKADCLAYLEELRWRKRPVCPYCGSGNSTPIHAEHRYHCNGCNVSYSVTVKTLFHQTHLPLQKWFLAVILLLRDKKRLAVRDLAESLQVNKNTAWYVSSRIRRAMVSSPEERSLLQEILRNQVDLDLDIH